MKRSVLVAAIGFAFIGALGAGQAQANTYCAELPADASCTQNFTGTTTSVQAAVTAADGNPGPDNVKVGPGTFVMASPAYLDSFGPDNQLTLTGSGPSTVLKGSDPTDPEIHFNAPAGSSINSLTISITDEAATSGKRGLVLTGDAPVANDLDVNFVSGATGDKTTGVVLQDGATLKNSRVQLYNANVNTAVASTGQGTQTVQGSTLTAFRDVDQRNTTGTVEVAKSALVAIGVGGLNQGGTLNIRDSVIVNPYGNGDGIFARSEGAFSDTLVEGTTILGTPTTGATPTVGVVAQASYGDPTPANTRFRLNSSVIYGYDYAITYAEFYPEDTLNIGVDSSAYDSTRVSEGAGLGTPTLDVHNLVDLNGVDPKFKDLPTGDYSLAPGSPLIDVGQAADPPVGSKDINGNPRACHGTSSGIIRRDIGAYEYRTDPNDDCTYPTAGISGPVGSAGDTTPTFILSSTKATPSYLCSIDNGAFATCPTTFTTPVLPSGDHDLKVKAKDGFGNIQPNPTDHAFTIEPASCANDASLCPPPTCQSDASLCPPRDTTPPTLKITSKVPRDITKAALKIAFRSSEAGSTFTCRVNKAKAKKCKSPFKAKLKKGRNTIVIVATDKAGNHSKGKKVSIKRKK